MSAQLFAAPAVSAQKWCANFFSDTFAEVHLQRKDARQLAAAVSFLTDVLHLGKDMHVFDQCCGIGDISLALAQTGVQVTGVDLMPSYIDTARKRAATAGTMCGFYTDDAGRFVPRKPCHAAFNWWTSFGYSPQDAENIKMLQRAYDALLPGGYFALDYMNSVARRASFAGQTVLTDRYVLPDGATSIWQSRLDKTGEMLVRTWCYTDAAGQSETQEGAGAKLYTAPDLQRLLQACGFTGVHFYGSDTGADYTAQSPRCIAVARKPREGKKHDAK